MKSFAVVAAAAGLAAAQTTSVTSTASQGATYSFTSISPKQTDPAGCASSYNGQFEISVVNVTQSHAKRSGSPTALTCTLNNGLLKDAAGRIGYIAANYQFQFDFGGQAGEIYTTGWSACSNGTLALGGSAIFYQCLSGSFYNLYSQSQGAQCVPIYIDILGGGNVVSSALPSSSQAVSQVSDGQVQASTSAKPVSQITDGQIQATTGTAKVVTQITDGQIQASTGTAKPVTQIGDGQIQATTGTSSAKPVTQIGDGQIQATTGTAKASSSASSTGRVVTQIGDGQIQASTSAAKPVSQISDGQIQAPTNGTRPSAATATVQAYTGAAAMPTAQLMAVAAGALAMLAL